MVGEATREVTRNDIRDNRVKDELERVKDELEPTTKNDLPHCQHTDEEIAKSFIEDVEAVKDQLHTKNDLGVDCISREDALMCLTGMFENREYEPSELIKIFARRIKTLPSVTPQEQFKPMVEIDLYSAIKQSYIEREVLDKIRAEIMQLDYDIEFIDYDYNDMAQTEEVHTIYREEVLQILDKYKAESEVQ